MAKVNRPKTDHGKETLFKGGGMAKHDDLAEDKKLIKKAFGMHDKQEHGGKHADLSKLKKGGMAMDKEPRRSVKGEHAVQKHAKRGAEIIKMAKGGRVEGKGMHSIQTKSKRGAIDVKMCGGGMMKKGK